MYVMPRLPEKIADFFAELAPTKAVDLKTRIISSQEFATNAENDNASAFGCNNPEAIPAANGCGALTRIELHDFYKRDLTARRGVLCIHYGRIMSLSIHDKCPYCSVGVVSTLDHFMPKSAFANLSITPDNLIPACKDCNFYKGSKRPLSSGERFFHPYLDPLPAGRWLRCEIRDEPGVVVEYSVGANPTIADDLSDRLAYQFREFRLGRLYTANAAAQLAVERERIGHFADEVVPGEIRAELNISFEAYKAVDENSWQTALYAALVASDWYVQGGWREL